MDTYRISEISAMILEMEEKLFAISGIRLPLDHKTGKEYIGSIKIKKI